MAEDFSANPRQAGNFTQSTETDLFQGYRDHSEFLPVVNRTESIQRFFGSTVNQLLSSGSTQTVDAYWGRLTGRSYNQGQELFQPESDATRLNYQFVPGTVRRDAGQVESAVSYINWLKRLESFGADTSNHDRLFNEPGYTLDLPINIDMFVNYTNYFWLEGNMPVIDVEPNAAGPIDIDAIVGLDQYTTPILSNNKSLEFVTGLRVRFTGSHVSSTSGDYEIDAVYYIENVGGHGGIKLLLSEDAAGNDKFLDVTPYKVLYPKGWDLDPWDTTTWDERDFFAEYNALTTRDREDISLNKSYIVMERWATDYNPWARSNRWFSLYALRTFGDFTGIDIEPYLNRRTRAQRPIIEWCANMELFNFCKNYVENVDYVMSIEEVVEILGGVEFFAVDEDTNFLQDGDVVLVAVDEPGGILLGDYNTDFNQDFYAGAEQGAFSTAFNVGFDSNLTGQYYAHAFRVQGVGTRIELVPYAVYQEDQYVVVNGGSQRGLSYCFDGAQWFVAQSKTEKNTAPLFNLYTDQREALESLPDTDFRGDKVFGYKENANGPIDLELGFAPTYSEGQGFNDFEFEFTLSNQRYSQNVSLTSAEEVRGYYNYRDCVRDEYFTGWSAIRDGQRVPVAQTVIADGVSQPKFDMGTVNTEYTTEYAVTWTEPGYRWFTRSYIDQIDIGRDNPDFVWKRETDYVIYDLILENGLDIVFTDPYGNSDPNIGVTVDAVANTITVNVDVTYAYNKILYRADTNDSSNVIFNGNNVVNGGNNVVTQGNFDRYGGEIVLSESNQQRYQVRRNGQLLIEGTDYTIDGFAPTEITVTSDARDGDVFELSYVADADLENIAYDVAPVHFYNATNEPFERASYSELFNHFDRQVTYMPGFEGKLVGENNYHKTRRIHAFDGLVRQQIFEAPKVEYLFDQEKINPVRTLKTFSNDYAQFKKFFKSKIKQLWETESWESVRELVDRALSDINIGKNENFKYANSDMAYFRQFERRIYSITNNDLSYEMPRVQNSFGDTKNHVQVWLNEYDGTRYTERQLELDIEYTINGQNIVLSAPAVRNGTPATLTVRWYNHSISSHIPYSTTKLGFFRPTQVEIVDGVLIGHDGSRHTASGTEFYFMNDVNFDVVTAALLDYERRVYNNLVDTHFTAFDMGEQYPSPHRPFSYDIEDLNSRLDDWYNRWAVREGVTEIDNVAYDAGNAFTWNYKTVGPNLGSWRALYAYYFGTDRPHTHPWEMLGYRTKPTWWDTYYSWSAGAQRDALIDALKNGQISEPGLGIPVVVDPKYARQTYNWDDVANPLVTTAGVLNDPVAANVVPAPDAIEASKPFVFGDWSETEDQWRKSSEYGFALAESYLQLKPFRTHELWWTLGRWRVNTNVTQTQWVDTDTCRRMNSNEIHNQLVQDGVITGVKVIDGGSGYAFANVDFPANAICASNASAEAFVSNGAVRAVAITNPGREYATEPSDTVIQGPPGASGAVLEYVLDFDFYVTHLGFNTLPAEEFTPEQSDSTELAEDLAGLSMEHVLHVGGFTDKRIMSLNIDGSYERGRVDIPQNNYDVVIDRSAPIKSVFFSGVKIEKVDGQGYRVSGYNLDSRFFVYTPVSASGQSVSESIGTATLERHLKFKNETVRIPYGHIFSRRQELYSFLLGLGNFYETAGFRITDHWQVEAKNAIRWALGDLTQPFFLNGVEEVLVYEQGTQGFTETVNVNYDGVPNVLDRNLKQIKRADMLVLRNETTTEYSTKDRNDRIYGLGIQVVELEHVIAIRKTTEFNDIIYDPARGIAQSRVRFEGERTRNWNGRLEAPGYLVRDTGLLLNMESTVREVERDWINSETKKLERLSRQTMGYNVGYAQPTYLKDTFIDGTASYRFEKGKRKYKGTDFAFDAMARNKNIFGKEFGQQLYEDWMVRLGDYGDMSEVEPLQFEVDPDLLKGDPQQFRFSPEFVSDNRSDLIIDLHRGGPYAVSGNYEQPFSKYSFLPLDNQTISISNEFQEFNKDAGLPLVSEVDYFVRSVDNISEVYDVNADYATIRNWNNITAYTKGDVVRLGSRVYRLTAESTGITRINDDIIIRGTQVFSTVSNGQTFIADGNTITFTKSSNTSETDTITVAGTTVSPSVPSGSTLTLDGVNVNFIKNETTVTWQDIVIDGAITNPQIANETGKTLVIGFANNAVDALTTVTVDFDETFTTETMQQIWVDAFGSGYGGDASADAIVRINALEALRFAYINANSIAAWTSWIDNYYSTASSPSLFVNPEYVGTQVAANLGAAWEAEARALIDIDLQIIANATGNAATEDQTSLITGPLNDATQFAADVSATQAALAVDPNLPDFAQWMLDNPSVGFVPGFEITVTSPTPPRFVTDTITTAVDKINTALTAAGATDISASSFFNDSGNVLRLTRTNTDEDYRLVVLTGNANADFGYANNTEGALSSTTATGGVSLTLDEVVTAINQVLIAGVTATNVGNAIQLLSTNNSLTISSSTAIPFLGLPTGVINANETSTSVPVDLSIYDVVDQINTANIPNLTAAQVEGALVLTFVGTQFVLGDGTANTELGIAAGTYESQTDTVNNQFDIADWETIQEPADFAIWAVDNIGSERRAQIASNRYQVYKTTDIDLEIYEVCAGTENGDDALVKCVKSHQLAVNDYVLILNSSSLPSIDGIHRVTAVANDNMFFVDEYIEKKGFTGKAIPLRPMRVGTPAAANNLLSDTRYINESFGLRDGSFVYVDQDTDDNGNPLPYGSVLRLVRESGGANFAVERLEEAKTKNKEIVNGVLYTNKNKSTVTRYEAFNPLEGIIPGIAEAEIDIRNEVDLAKYNSTTDADLEIDPQLKWGKEQLGLVWWDLSNAIYLNYDQGPDEYKQEYWGQLFPTSTIDVYEWTKSPVTPDEYLDAVRSGTIVDGIPSTGEPYTVTDQFGDVQYYWTEEFEVNINTNQLEAFYYFWVRNKTTVPNPGRTYTTTQLAVILEDPNALGLNWIAATGTNTLLVSGLEPVRGFRDLVMQVNFDRGEADYHQEFALLSEGDLRTVIPEWLHLRLRDSLAGFSQRTRTFRYVGWFPGVIYYPQDVVEASNGRFYVAHKVGAGNDPVTDVNNDQWQLTEPVNVNPDGDYNGFNTVEYSLAKTVPDLSLHPFERVGIRTRPMQTMFENIDGARQSVVEKLNSQLLPINLIDGDLRWREEFDRTVQVGDETVDIRDYWSYADWNANLDNPYDSATADRFVTVFENLAELSPEEGEIAQVTTSDYEDRIERQSAYCYENGDWVLIFREKATIQFNDLLWRDDIALQGWDIAPWDTVSWDKDSKYAVAEIFDSFYRTLWTGRLQPLYTDLWFHMAKYVLSEQDEVDWLFKSSYINFVFEDSLEKDYNKYYNERLDELFDYINTVKPFRSKVNDAVVQKAADENVTLTFSDAFEIRVQTNSLDENVDEVNTRSFRLSQGTDSNNYASQIVNENKQLLAGDIAASATVIPLLTDGVTTIDAGPGAIWINGERIEYAGTINPAIDLGNDVILGSAFSAAFSTAFGGVRLLTGVTRGTQGTLARPHSYADVVEQEFALAENTDLSNWGTGLPLAWQDAGVSLVDPSNTEANGVTINAGNFGTIDPYGAFATARATALAQDEDAIREFNEEIEGLIEIYLSISP